MFLDAYLGSPQHENGVLSSIVSVTLPFSVLRCHVILLNASFLFLSLPARVVVLVSGFISTSISNSQLASSLFCFSSQLLLLVARLCAFFRDHARVPVPVPVPVPCSWSGLTEDESRPQSRS